MYLLLFVVLLIIAAAYCRSVSGAALDLRKVHCDEYEQN